MNVSHLANTTSFAMFLNIYDKGFRIKYQLDICWWNFRVSLEH